MQQKPLNINGVVLPAQTITRTYENRVGIWEITSLKIIFLVGQANTLFIQPQLIRITGSPINLLFPDSEITGDDYMYEQKAFDLLLNPGASLLFRIRNSSTINSRRYHIMVSLSMFGGDVA